MVTLSLILTPKPDPNRDTNANPTKVLLHHHFSLVSNLFLDPTLGQGHSLSPYGTASSAMC